MKLQARGIAADVHADGARRRLFAGLDLEIEAGQLWTVVGPNGAGKTTLLRILAGLRRADAGVVELDGRPLETVPRRERGKRLAYLPQSTPLYHDLQVHELVMLGRAPHLGRMRPPSRADRDAVGQALARVGAEPLAHRRISSLSGGERQRVMIARMLATAASLLVLDEPTTALDIGHALDLLELCRTLARGGRALVVALHDLELARRYGTHAVCLANETAYVGAPSAIFDPALLHATFDVDVRLTPDGLSFSPRRR